MIMTMEMINNYEAANLAILNIIRNILVMIF